MVSLSMSTTLKTEVAAYFVSFLKSWKLLTRFQGCTMSTRLYKTIGSKVCCGIPKPSHTQI